MEIADLEARALDGDQRAIEELIHIYETNGPDKNEELAVYWRKELENIQVSENNNDQTVVDTSEVNSQNFSNNPSGLCANLGKILEWRKKWISGGYSKEMLVSLQSEADNPYAQWSCARQLLKAYPTNAFSYYEEAQKILLPYIDHVEINHDCYDLLIETGDLFESQKKYDDAFRLYMQAHELSTAKIDTTSSWKLLHLYQKSLGCSRDDARIEQLEQELISSHPKNPEELYRLMIEIYLFGNKVNAGICAQYLLNPAVLAQNVIWRPCAEIMLHFCNMQGDKGTVPSSTDVQEFMMQYKGDQYIDTLKALVADKAIVLSQLSENDSDKYWITHADNCKTALKEMNESGSKVIPANWYPLSLEASSAAAEEARVIEKKRKSEELKKNEQEKVEEQKRIEQENAEKLKRIEQEKAEEEKKEQKKKRRHSLIKIVIVILAVAAVFGIKTYQNRIIRIDPFEYLHVTFQGTDGNETVDYTFDYDAISKDTGKLVSSEDVLINILSDGENLNNNDTVRIEILSTSALEKHGIVFSKTTEDFPVPELSDESTSSETADSSSQTTTEIPEDTLENTSEKTVTVLVDRLNIRTQPTTGSKSLGHAANGATYYYSDVVENGGYTWYQIGDGEWIADKNGEYLSVTGN